MSTSCFDPAAHGLLTTRGEDRWHRARRLLRRPLSRLRIAFTRLRTGLFYERYRTRLGATPPDDDGAPLRYDSSLLRETDSQLADLGMAVHSYHADQRGFLQFVSQAEYSRRHRDYLSYYKRHLGKKLLEQFVAAELLALQPGDVLIDIAAEQSPFVEIAARLYDCQTWVHDLAYKPGVHGRRIGSRASQIPLPDVSIDKISVLCSLEHFEGDEDVLFLREMARLLKRGGRGVVVPLYLAPRPVNYTEPACAWRPPVFFDRGAEVRATKRWWSRFMRFYSCQQLRERLLANLPAGMEASVHRINNFTEFDPACFVAYALLVRKP